jgi:hypothetical protein
MKSASGINWDRVHRSNYESAAFSSSRWASKANDLLHSAKLLEPELSRHWRGVRRYLKDQKRVPHPDYWQATYFMLIGYAVENMLKAAIIDEKAYEFRQRFVSKKTFPRTLRSHDLVNLAGAAGFAYDTNEEDLLRRLTRSAIWAGRYPAPLDYKDLHGPQRFSDGKTYSVSYFAEADMKRLKRLVRRVSRELRIDLQ